MNKVFLNPIILALDTSSLEEAKLLALKLKDHIGGIKIGMEFFNSFGPEGVEAIKKFNIPIFLDLKLHDIPATVYKTISTLLTLNPAIINVHASGGREMMRAASRARKDSNNKNTKIIAVTILTTIHISFSYKWTGIIGLYKIAKKPKIQTKVISCFW